jgi:hypothetical protein
MNSFFSLRSIPAVILGACLMLPAVASGRDKIKVYRDLDGDGHYNKKTYDVKHRAPYYGNHYRGGYGYGYPYHYSRPYYGSYGRPYYGYSRPYYGYSYGPSIGVSYYSRPSYSYETTRVYRGSSGYDSSDDLAVDVQRALKRRGYYTGSVDGDIGPGSRSAIRAYQADRGLPVTGRIDSRLLRALGIG